jgi:type IV pilus assembly protein PilO
MKELLDRIFDLPKHQKIGLLVSLIVLLLMSDYFYLFSPLSLKISDLSQNVAAARSERDKKKALVANLPQLKQQFQLADGMLKQAIAQLPDRKEIPDLLTSISNRAREVGLEILLFRPRAENPQEFYAEIPVDVVVRGGFHNVVSFFDEVGRLSRLVNISNIEIKNPMINQDRVIVDSTSLVAAFRFMDEAERARIAAERAAKKK